ncbi:MAG: hypothetical protein WDM90_03995 [Ferruginibacter sp.]
MHTTTTTNKGMKLSMIAAAILSLLILSKRECTNEKSTYFSGRKSLHPVLAK